MNNLEWGLAIANKVTTRTQSVSSSILLGERDKHDCRKDNATCGVIVSSRKFQAPQPGTRKHRGVQGIIDRDAAGNKIRDDI